MADEENKKRLTINLNPPPDPIKAVNKIDLLYLDVLNFPQREREVKQKDRFNHMGEVVSDMIEEFKVLKRLRVVKTNGRINSCFHLDSTLKGNVVCQMESVFRRYESFIDHLPDAILNDVVDDTHRLLLGNESKFLSNRVKFTIIKKRLKTIRKDCFKMWKKLKLLRKSLEKTLASLGSSVSEYRTKFKLFVNNIKPALQAILLRREREVRLKSNSLNYKNNMTHLNCYMDQGHFNRFVAREDIRLIMEENVRHNCERVHKERLLKLYRGHAKLDSKKKQLRFAAVRELQHIEDMTPTLAHQYRTLEVLHFSISMLSVGTSQRWTMISQRKSNRYSTLVENLGLKNKDEADDNISWESSSLFDM